MRKDFTYYIFEKLIISLIEDGYSFITFSQYLKNNNQRKFIILRHDVDDLKYHSFTFAQIENKYGIKGTFNFRIVPQSYDKHLIWKIHSMNHEIGFHYETVDSANGNIEIAWKQFSDQLARFREIVPVDTVCMHGSPWSKFDNKDLWNKYNYKSLGIIGEPYYDVNFDKVFYLTDTGRRWDGWKYSVRDKLPQQEKWLKEGLIFHSTKDIIKAIESGSFPKQVMFTFHPQRWTDKKLPWLKELAYQYLKNVVKHYMIALKS